MSNIRPLPEDARVVNLTRDQARDLLEKLPENVAFRVALKNPVPFPGLLIPPLGVQDISDASFHVSKNQAIAAAKYYLTKEMEDAGGRVPIAEFRNRSGKPTYLVG